ncbi:anti-sigma F factor [Heliorestis acidaminivorans]|uniref:Anti-sigma F factor n=1 Tax=Heliorestis acidaminivorans TaxID=553427 RepID=A0A6I0F0B2_9FIRM|nr:anti-sigma F factor [Heliorestis acidaminivorans]KAB2951704.1 anti-sigma F factor [Heliorestis acidaminivorans]
MSKVNRVKMQFPSHPENVSLARVVVATMMSSLDFTLTNLDDVKVAVSEAVSNSIMHGYQNESNGLIDLTIAVDGNGLEVIVEDRGQGIVDIEKAMEASYSTEPDRMGLGFVFMQSFMDELEVLSEVGKGTRVRLYKSVPQLQRSLQ